MTRILGILICLLVSCTTLPAAPPAAPCPDIANDGTSQIATPINWQACLDGAGRQTYLEGLPCYKCTDAYGFETVISNPTGDHACTQRTQHDDGSAWTNAPQDYPVVICAPVATSTPCDLAASRCAAL